MGLPRLGVRAGAGAGAGPTAADNSAEPWWGVHPGSAPATGAALGSESVDTNLLSFCLSLYFWKFTLQIKRNNFFEKKGLAAGLFAPVSGLS